MRFLLAVLGIAMSLPVLANPPRHWDMLDGGDGGRAESRIDKRKYLDDKTLDPSLRNYLQEIIVRIGDFCTGFLVGENLIMTAAHCFDDASPRNESVRRASENSTYNISEASYLGKARDELHDSTDDWALLIVPFRFYGEKKPKLGRNPKFGEGYISAGYGGVRILRNDEIHRIKPIAIEVLAEMQRTGDTSGRGWVSNVIRRIDEKIKELGDNSLKPIFDDGDSLKIHENCIVTGVFKTGVQTDCHTWPGNSGGPLLYKDKDGFIINGIASSGLPNFQTWHVRSNFVNPEEYYAEVRRELEKQKKSWDRELDRRISGR